MKKYTIEELKKGYIAIKIRTQEEGRKVVDNLKMKYYGNFPIKDYQDFCIAPFEYNGKHDGSICHTEAESYRKNNYEIIEFSQIDFQENLVECIEIW